MSYLQINNVKIQGLAACVPALIEENLNSILMDDVEIQKFITTTGVERRHIADNKTCTSDLGIKAAEKLISELKWDKADIEALIFVTQTPDYLLPATSCLVQDRLGLSTDCYSADLSLGCSGWVYGLSYISSLMNNGSMRKGLLVVGDTVLKINSSEDKSTYPLFGDAATVVALEYIPSSDPMFFHFGTDGSGYESIIVPHGGQRNPIDHSTLDMIEYEPGIKRNQLHTYLDGMSVFSFGISKAPETVSLLLSKFFLNKEEIDYYIFHQANFFMNEKIRKKLKIDPEKVPYSLKDFGNTSSATIPLTIVTQLKKELINRKLNLLGCAFGVGLSWGSVYFSIENIVCPELIIY